MLAMMAVPDVGSSSVVSILIVVLLPAPLGRTGRMWVPADVEIQVIDGGDFAESASEIEGLDGAQAGGRQLGGASSL